MEDNDKGGTPKPAPNTPGQGQRKKSLKSNKLEKEGFKPDPDVEAGHE